MNENNIRDGFKNFKRDNVNFEEFQNTIPH